MNIWQSLTQAETESNVHDSNPVMVFKRNRSKAYATVELDFLLELLHNNMQYNILKENQTLDIEKLKSIFSDSFLQSLQKTKSLEN